MVVQLDRLMRDVRVALDHNMNSTPLADLGDVDTLSLDDIIRSKVLEGVEQVHKAAPYHLLETGHNFGDAVYWGELESGWVLLPSDFMRLVVFEMDDWERAVYSAISVDDQEYEQQRSRYKGIRGTSQKPICAIATRPEGRVLEFYSCKSTDAQVSRAVYIPYPKIVDDSVDVSERCYQAVVYTVAGLTLVALGEVEQSKSLFELAKENLV